MLNLCKEVGNLFEYNLFFVKLIIDIDDLKINIIKFCYKMLF